MSAYESLPPWQQHFVDLYVEGAHAPTPTAAYRLVRPEIAQPAEAASQLMARQEIKLAIDERLRRRREETEFNEAWVLERLQTIADRCMQPVYDAKGRLVRMMSDTTNAVRALELLGKHFGMWKERLEDPAGGPIRTVQIVKFYDDDGRPRITNAARV